MANIIYNQFMLDLAEKKINLEDDLFKVRLCMTNSIAGGDTDATRRVASLDALENVGAGIDMFDGKVNSVTYVVATDDTITTPTANVSSASGVNRVNWSGDNVEWATVGGTGANGTRNILGALVYWQPGSGTINETTRIPVCFIQFSSAIETDGSDITIKWDGGASSGNILRMTQASS